MEKNLKVIKILYGIFALVLIIGAFLKIMHYEIGSKIVFCGIIAYVIISTMENYQLKKIIKKHEDEKCNEAK